MRAKLSAATGITRAANITDARRTLPAYFATVLSAAIRSLFIH
jgi:hypothetical protein